MFQVYADWLPVSASHLDTDWRIPNFSQNINTNLKKTHISTALKTGLSKSYEDVLVELVDSPDLRKAPFHLAAKGLSGSQTIVDIGAETYLLPKPNFTKIYDLVEVAQKALPNAKTISIIGPGAGPFMLTDQNCEV